MDDHAAMPRIASATGAFTGVWGRSMQIVDGHHRCVRQPGAANRPLSMWSNRWSTMPSHASPQLRMLRPDAPAVLDRVPGSDVAVIRQPFATGDAVLGLSCGRPPPRAPRPRRRPVRDG